MSNQPARPWILRCRRRYTNGQWCRWRTFATYATEERAIEGMQCLRSDDWRAYIRNRHTGEKNPPNASEV